MEAWLYPIKDDRGSLREIVMMLQDVGQRKQAEKVLQDAYADLEQRVQERTAQLSAINQQLQQQIAERKQAETALQDSERRFRAIFNQTFQFIGLMQPDGLLLEANQTALDFGGLARSQVVGRPFWQARWWSLSSETQEHLQAAIVQAAAGEFVRYEVDVLGAGDTIVTIDFSIKPVRNAAGDVVLLIPEGRDITAMKQAEQALRSFEAVRQSEQQFRLVAESMPQIVWTALPDGSVDYYNHRWTEYSGIPQQAGHNWGWKPVLHPEDEQRTVDAWKQAVQTQQLYECEHRIRRADGTFRWFLSRGLPLRDQQGQIIKWFGTATDIHEQKQVQAELQESQERFRQLAETVNDVFWLMDIKTQQVLYVNPAYEQVWGRSPQSLYDDKIGWLEAIHPDERERIQAIFREQMVHGAYDTTYRIVRPDGSIRWIRDRGFPVHNATGEVYRLAGLAEDITEGKLADAALRLSTERFRIALQHSPIAVFNQDQQLRYTWIHNPKLGYAAQEVLGKTDADLMHPEDAAYLMAIKRQVLTSGTGLRQEVHASREGEFSYYDLTVEPLRDDAGEVVGITAAAIDITDRKRTEAELRTRAMQQAAIAHLGQQALSGLDVQALMQTATHLIATILKVEYCHVLELLSDGKLLLLRSGFGFEADKIGQTTVSTGVDSQAGYTLLAAEPVIVTDLRTETRFQASPLLFEHPVVSGLSSVIAGQLQPFGVLGAHTTHQRTFTQDDVHFLQATANILAEAIQRQQANETLQQQSQALALANRLKDEFLATISHELRTPLNSMLGWSQLLSSRSYNPETTTRALETISRNTQALAQLVESVLDMSDIIRGRLDLQVAAVDLALVIEQAIAAIDFAAEAKQIQIHSYLDGAVGMVLGDAVRLQQAVWNLLSNAVKFTPDGGQITVRLDCLNDQAQIQVSDTGQGISPTFLPFVFDRFRQEDNSLARPHGGLGLGLAIVRYLVELHGGTIQAESPGTGQGATFTVTLPIRSILQDFKGV